MGGKLLTNYLKELVSYRQWNMMEDTAVVNQVRTRPSTHTCLPSPRRHHRCCWAPALPWLCPGALPYPLIAHNTAVSVAQVKEALCFVAQHYDEELAACDPRSSRRRGLKLSKKPSDAGDATGAGGGAAAGSGAGSGSGSGSGEGEGEAKSGSDAAGPDATKGSIRAEFVLPDFKLILKGFVRVRTGVVWCRECW